MEAFVSESNLIEGITREPTQEEIAAHISLLAMPMVKIEMLQQFVSVVQPNAVIRDHPSLNVRVGKHVAPRGGVEVVQALDGLLAHAGHREPWATHKRYEWLHPFTDGNGRSGRALWLWQMKHYGHLDRALALGFLHAFYYQTLEQGL
jgi:hypothetical protein